MMRKYLLSTMIACLPIVLFAQTQQGYVKTKGRMVNGQHVAGKGLPGATVNIQGGKNIGVKNANGSFSFVVPANTFMVQSVQKNGYELVDDDALRKSYQHSANPLYLVMETPEQQIQDELDAERKLRRTLQRKLRQREDEIDAMQATVEEKQRLLQQLYKDQENNEKLIADMAKEYSQMDYDQMDSLNQRISDAIVNGRLMEADSLLRSKGDMKGRIAEVRKEQQAEAQEEQEITQRQENLEASKKGTKKKLADIAADCYKFFDRFKLENQHDSAAYYIMLRADLDSTNIDWQNEAGLYAQNYMAHYDFARFYYLRALHAVTGNSIPSMEEILKNNPQKTEVCWNNLGYLEEQLGDIDKAIMAYEMASVIWERSLDKRNISYIRLLTNKGVAYKKKGEYDIAIRLYKEALDSLMSFPGYYEEAINLFNNMGTLYLVDDVDKALKLFQMAQKELEKYYGDTNPKLAVTYYNVAICKLRQKNTKEAQKYAEDAYRIATSIFGRNHPNSVKIQSLVEMIKSEQEDINHSR